MYNDYIRQKNIAAENRTPSNVMTKEMADQMYDDYMKQKLMMINPSPFEQPSDHLKFQPTSVALTNLKKQSFEIKPKDSQESNSDPDVISIMGFGQIDPENLVLYI